jgi:TonB family protein
MPQSFPVLVVVLFSFALSPIESAKHFAASPQTTVTTSQLEYPDSTAGLEHLAKDIIKAQKTNDGARAEMLLRSLILPQPHAWYERVFGPIIAGNEGALYERASASVPPTLAREFLDAGQFNLNSMEVRRFDRSCDDNAGELTFSILHARVERVPLYEIIFVKGNKLLRFASFAYVDGGFRFVIPPKLEGKVFPPPVRKTSSNPTPAEHAENSKELDRVTVGAFVQAARLVNKVAPQYPDIAKREHLQGTVQLHAIIGTDGSLAHVYVLSGYCSLAQASLDAVQEWKYAPTMLMGNPVEVDTQITVIFRLQ